MNEEKFKEGMAMLFEVFERQPTDMLMKAYWAVLKKYNDKEWEKAVLGILENKTFNKMPTPGELNTQITGDDALKAWLMAREAAGLYGAQYSVKFPNPVIHSVIRAMGGWQEFCFVPEDEKVWKQKEFENLYRVMIQKEEHPEQCIGMYYPNNTVEHETLKITSGETRKEIA